MIIKISNIAHILKREFMRMHERNRVRAARSTAYKQGFHISGGVWPLYSLFRHTFARKHITTRRKTTEDLPRLSHPSLFLLPIRDRVTWFWNLSKKPSFVIFRAKIEAKSVCKVPPDFPRFPLRFRASCYYLSNIDLTQSLALLSCREFIESCTTFKRCGDLKTPGCR